MARVWPQDFSPPAQDRAALYILQSKGVGKEYPERKTALGYILQGDVEKAVNETRLYKNGLFCQAAASKS